MSTQDVFCSTTRLLPTTSAHFFELNSICCIDFAHMDKVALPIVRVEQLLVCVEELFCLLGVVPKKSLVSIATTQALVSLLIKSVAGKC